MKLLFRHSSNSRKLSGQKFHNELACVFTAYYASKNADWNQQQLLNGWRHFGQSEQRKSSALFPIQSEKSPDSGIFTCDPTKKCIVPSSRERHKGIIGRGHDLKLGPRGLPIPETIKEMDTSFRRNDFWDLWFEDKRYLWLLEYRRPFVSTACPQKRPQKSLVPFLPRVSKEGNWFCV